MFLRESASWSLAPAARLARSSAPARPVQPGIAGLVERDDSNLFYVDKDLRIAHPGLDTMPFLGGHHA